MLRAWLGVAAMLAAMAAMAGGVWAAAPAAGAAPAPAPAVEVAQVAQQDLAGHLELLPDPGGRWGADPAALATADFAPARPGDVLQSFDAGAFWLRLALHNPQQQPVQRWLVVANPRVQWVTFFVQAQGRWQQVAAGTAVALERKPVWSADAVLPLTLAPHQTLQVLVRLQSVTALNLSARLWQPQAYQQAQSRGHLRLALVLGALLMCAALALLVAPVLRDPDYAWFAGVLLCSAGLEAARSGLLQLYLWPADQALAPQALLMLAGAGQWFLQTLALHSMALRQRWPGLARMLQTLRWVVLAAMALCWLDYGLAARTLSLAGVLGWTLCLVAAARGWRAGEPSARLFALAFGVAWLLELLRQAVNWGVLPAPAVLHGSQAVAMLVSAPLILWGLTDRAQRLAARVLAERALSQAKSDFLARVSHELRSPLTTIIGFARMLQRGSDRLTVQEGASGIERSGLELMGLIDELLEESRLRAGRLSLTPRPLNLPAWWDALCQEARQMVQASGNRLVLQLQGDLPAQVALDGARLRQVLRNLLSNACRHTQAGEITLSCRVQAQAAAPDGAPDAAPDVALELAVSDTGEGIARHEQAAIFEPFVQARSARPRQPRLGDQNAAAALDAPAGLGSGLGLTIARELVQLMGGRLSVRSAPGQGSRFAFDLRCPVLPPAPVAGLPAAHGDAAKPAGTHRREELCAPDVLQAGMQALRQHGELATLAALAHEGEVSGIAAWLQRMRQAAPHAAAALDWIDDKHKRLDLRRLQQLEQEFDLTGPA